MQDRHYIDNRWFRAKEVSISKSEITCVLDPRRPYDLAEAYEDAPHVALMNLIRDQDWEAFVARWGPLRISDRELRLGRSEMRLDWGWAFQRRLTAFAKLLDSFGKPEQGERLRRFLVTSAEEAKLRDLGTAASTLSFGAFLTKDSLAKRLAEQVGGEEIAFDSLQSLWLEQASAQALNDAVKYLIQMTSFTSTHSLYVRTEGRRRGVVARLGLDNLEDALEWMIWNGYWMRRPQMFCQECQRAFRPESAHPRKYCSNECAHRATDRTWRRKKRAKEKKGE